MNMDNAKHLLSLPFGGFKRGQMAVVSSSVKSRKLPGLAACDVAALGAGDQSKPKPMDHENGHEIILRTLIRHRTLTRFTLLSGEQITGVVSQFDKTTITVRPTGAPNNAAGKPVTIFKHAIETFSGLETLQ